MDDDKDYNKHMCFRSTLSRENCLICLEDFYATIKCNNCNKVGHNTNMCNAKKKCFRCGSNEHLIKDCKRCYRCGNFGHISRYCRIFCKFCKKKNHKSKDCWFKPINK